MCKLLAGTNYRRNGSGYDAGSITNDGVGERRTEELDSSSYPVEPGTKERGSSAPQFYYSYYDYYCSHSYSSNSSNSSSYSYSNSDDDDDDDDADADADDDDDDDDDDYYYYY